MTTLHIDLPSEAGLTASDLREALGLQLYRSGRISLRSAAKVAGMGLKDFKGVTEAQEMLNPITKLSLKELNERIDTSMRDSKAGRLTRIDEVSAMVAKW